MDGLLLKKWVFSFKIFKIIIDHKNKIIGLKLPFLAI